MDKNAGTSERIDYEFAYKEVGENMKDVGKS